MVPDRGFGRERRLHRRICPPRYASSGTASTEAIYRSGGTAAPLLGGRAEPCAKALAKDCGQIDCDVPTFLSRW